MDRRRYLACLSGVLLTLVVLEAITLPRGQGTGLRAASSPARPSVVLTIRLTIRAGGRFSDNAVPASAGCVVGQTCATPDRAAVPWIITARAGQPVRVTITNSDSVLHTFYVPVLGIFALIPAARQGTPTIITVGWVARRAGIVDVRDVPPCSTPAAAAAHRAHVRVGMIRVTA